MRAVWITKFGGPEVLRVGPAPDPLPGPGEVRVRVAAAGLSFADVMARQGLYPDAPKPPCVVGYEVAGVVDALGADVTGVPGSGSQAGAALVSPAGATSGAAAGRFVPRVGDRVLAMVWFGGHAEAVCVPAAAVLPVPDGMGFEQAAAVPVNYLTAYHLLVRVAAVRPGERVLVHAAAGGAGIAVLQLCHGIAGVTTFGTASAAKHDVLREEGCTHPIDYRGTDYVSQVRRLTGGEGVDVVLDPLGGPDWKKGLSLLRPGGRLVAYGFANAVRGDRRRWSRLARQLAGVPVVTPLGLMDRNRTVGGVSLGHLWSDGVIPSEYLSALQRLLRDGTVRPRIDAVFPFADAAAAHQRITERHNVGKVILVP